METRIGVSLVLCSLFMVSVLCQNATTTSPCQSGDSGCKVEGIGKNITKLAENSTNDTKPTSISVEGSRARAMNFTSAFQDGMHNNEMEMVTRMHAKEHSIDDVSMDDMDDDNNLNFANFTFNPQTAGGGGGGKGSLHGNESSNSKKSTAPASKNSNSGTCTDRDGKVYKLGEKFTKGCDETCQCQKDGVVCSQQCKMPYVVKGRNKDPHCDEEPVEGSTCCVRLICSTVPDLETEPLEDCIYKNVSYKRGSTIKDGCESVCLCEAAGRVSCKARCPPIQNMTSDKCVALPDKNDPCCTIVLCDVEEHDVNKIGTTVSDEGAITSSTMDNQIVSATAVNDTTVSLTFAEKIKNCLVDMSLNGVHWENAVCKDNKISGLQPGKKYYFRLKNTASNKVEVTMPSANQITSSSCTYKGKTYKIGEEFHDGCTAFCMCDTTGVECAPIECPTDFGLDVLDPHCLDWETSPPDFVPTPPHCCPDKVHCRNNGSCTYNGEIFSNWSELPTTVTGCDKICFCEMGNVSCQPNCPPVSEMPPKNLPCPAEQAVLAHPPNDDCCTVWTCPNTGKIGNESVATHLEHNRTASLDQKHKQPNTNYAPNLGLYPNRPLQKLPSPIITASNETNEEYYPGPFSPQYFSNKGNETGPHKPKPHHVLTDLLSPFHLEEFAPEIDKELHSNATEPAKKGKKPTKGHHSKYEEEDGDDNDESYDEKNQYEDLFTDIFTTKNNKNNKYATKHPFWTPIAPPKHGHPGSESSKDTKAQQPPAAKPATKEPESSKANADSTTERGPTMNTEEEFEKATDVAQGNPFLPYHPNIPYTMPNPIFSNLNPNLKHPPHEILIHQSQGAPTGFNHKFKPPTVGDANQPEEFYHIVDNDAYTDEQQLRLQQQNLHFGPGQNHGTHASFGPQQVVKLNKNGIRPPNQIVAGEQDIVNVEDVLTHLHNENSNTNNNIHLPNLLHGPEHSPIHQVLNNHHNNYPFQNYPHETLNVDQTSHPLLLHPELVSHNGNDSNREEIRMRVLEAVDENTVRLVFSVPSFLVGLQGRIELRYTSDQQNTEPSTWEQQILAPPNDLIATKELEFELGSLQPNTTYKIKISVMMHDIENAPSSSILTIKTLAPTTPPTTLPPILPVEPDLRVVEVNATYAKIAWRMFSDFELQFIDGVQLRYKELDDKIYAATPLIHRAVTTYTLEELKPDSTYEVKIFFIPFAGQTTELQAHQTVQIKTTVENDPYKFEITMEIHHVKTTSIEISWSGVPYPEDKYVHIVRAIYQSDGSREEVSSFKAAKRDSPQSILIQDLKPGTRYRVWLEVYLTNGRTKKSNVKDFVTKHGLAVTPSTSQGKLEGMAIVETNNYYGPLVAVSVLAAIAVMTSVVLLLILAKKHGTNKAPITTPINRKTNSSAAYDNPSYKTYENDKNGNSTKNGSIALTVFPKTPVEKET